MSQEASIIDVLDASPQTTEAPAAEETPAAPTEIAEALQNLEQKVNGPTPEEIRAENLALLQEKRAKIRAEREAKKQKSNYEDLVKGATSTKETYSKELSEWTESFRDPKQLVKAFEKRGVDPYTLWNTLSEGILGEQTPEAKKQQEFERLQQETLNKVSPEVLELKKRLEAREKQLDELLAEREASKQTRAQQMDQEFVSYLSSDPEGEEIWDHFDDRQVVQYAHQIHQHMVENGETPTFANLKARMVAGYKQYVLSLNNRREERIKRRQPTVTTPVSEQKPSAKSSTKTISNKIATEASKAHPDPNEDEAQRQAAAREELKSLFHLS